MYRLRIIAAVGWTLIILVLCWTPQVLLPVEEDPNSWQILMHLDKIVHVGIFAVFSLLWLHALSLSRNSALRVVLAGLALAVITEVVQTLPIIQRDGGLDDVIADLAGVLLGFPLVVVLETLWKRRAARRAAESLVTKPGETVDVEAS